MESFCIIIHMVTITCSQRFFVKPKNSRPRNQNLNSLLLCVWRYRSTKKKGTAIRCALSDVTGDLFQQKHFLGLAM